MAMKNELGKYKDSQGYSSQRRKSLLWTEVIREDFLEEVGFESSTAGQERLGGQWRHIPQRVSIK